MALFIRDSDVNALAEELRRLTKAATKTEAVRGALLAQLAAVRQKIPARDCLERSKAMADALAANNPSFDIKAYTDKSWGDM